MRSCMKKQCSVQDSYGVGKSMEKSLGHSPAWKNFLGHFGTRVDSGIFGKKRLNARGFSREYLRSCTGYGPGRSVKRRGKSSCLH